MPHVKASEPDPFDRIAPHYDALMENVPYDLWAQYVAQLALRSGRPTLPGENLLDLATGTGSLAIQFATQGCCVTGIDRSQPMLHQAGRNARARDLHIAFLCRDLRDFQLPPEFDHALCLYDSLNYITEPAGIEHTFANVRAALKPNGLFIFDVNTVQALEAELFTQKNPPAAAVEYTWKSKYNKRTRLSRIKMDFHVVATGDKISAVHRQRAYTDQELRDYLSNAAFAQVQTYEAYQFIPPTPKSDRVFYVATAHC